MERRFIILYGSLAAAASIALILCWIAAPPPVRVEVTPKPGRLSAITPKGQAATVRLEEANIGTQIGALKTEKLRLKAQLEALVAGSDPGDETHIPVDLESFCRHFGFVLKPPFLTLTPSEALTVALELSELERQALERTTIEFFQRLQSLDRESMQLVYVDDSSIKLKIPYRNEARSALFEELEGELDQLLGPGRAQVAAETFYRNELIGSASCERNFIVNRSGDGKFRISAQIIPTLAFFPGTNIPYDGTPGIQPELFTARSIKSETTIDSATAEQALGGLVDFDRWQPRTPN